MNVFDLARALHAWQSNPTRAALASFVARPKKLSSGRVKVKAIGWCMMTKVRIIFHYGNFRSLVKSQAEKGTIEDRLDWAFFLFAEINLLWFITSLRVLAKN